MVEVKTKAEPQPKFSGPAPRNRTNIAAASLAAPPAQFAAAVQSAPAPGLRGIRERIQSRVRAASQGVTATFTVNPGQSIQAAVDRAQAGDRVEVMPGVYNQTVSIDREGIELVGLVINGERAILDGQGTIADAILGSAGNLTVEGFHIRHYSGNGIVVNKASNVAFRDLVVEDGGLYAVYPVECNGVLVERCVVSGAKDAGIYVGQSRNIVVRDNEIFNNVAGIEIENSVNALVHNNSAHHNTGGILVFLLPSGASKQGSQCRVVGNRIWENNHVNFAKPGSIVSYLPKGTGTLLMAADNTEITGNQIFGNNSSGIMTLSFLSAQYSPKEKFELDIEPNHDNNLIHDNIYADNGKDPAPMLKVANIPGADLLWDGQGTGNGWREAETVTRHPEQLPTESALIPIDLSAIAGMVGGM
ncbi:right-handed parallel beta-helix repeat-containing protein [Candidatus Sumerlaeota bacterium]|nr:right-handed parallel beta-helix repeat-containing protein [Candidatus Sumerlaeota bacterium]